jgi:tRNA A22 N-methylase
VEFLRFSLYEAGFGIDSEDFAEESGKLYVIMSVTFKGLEHSRKLNLYESHVGICNISHITDMSRLYVKKTASRLEKIIKAYSKDSRSFAESVGESYGGIARLRGLYNQLADYGK